MYVSKYSRQNEDNKKMQREENTTTNKEGDNRTFKTVASQLKTSTRSTWLHTCHGQTVIVDVVWPQYIVVILHLAIVVILTTVVAVLTHAVSVSLLALLSPFRYLHAGSPFC